MLLGRAISATFGTATIPFAYRDRPRRVSAAAAAGVLAAFLLAGAVIHLRESHFFSLDVSMTFFTVARPATSRCGSSSAATSAREAGSALAFGLGHRVEVLGGVSRRR